MSLGTSKDKKKKGECIFSITYRTKTRNFFEKFDDIIEFLLLLVKVY